MTHPSCKKNNKTFKSFKSPLKLKVRDKITAFGFMNFQL